jgi:hypothetical protein
MTCRHLRFVASVGEPLNPEAVRWGREVLGRPIHDNWWQTETGGIMIANYRGEPIKPGSMGRPLPGIEAAIVERVEAAARSAGGRSPGPRRAGAARRLAVDVPRLSRTTRALSQVLRRRLVPERRPGPRDADGYFWFVGRADDMIKSAGHLIGPFEVESALLEHEAVAEAAAIGIPDPPPARSSRPSWRSSRASPRRACASRCSPMPASASGRPSRRARSTSAEPAEDAQRQDHAPAAAGARARSARGGHLDPGERRANEPTQTLRRRQAPPEPGACPRPAAEMLRIRRFEERCAELYTQEKIRGFLHLYIGEEAVSRRGRCRPAARGCGRRHLPRARPRAGQGGLRAVMAEMYGKQEGCSRGRGGSMHLFDKRDALLRRQRDRRRRPAARGRAGARRQDARTRPRDGAASSARARWPRARSTRA